MSPRSALLSLDRLDGGNRRPILLSEAALGTQMPFKIATAAASFRAATEDRHAVHRINGGLVVVVADGAGGISGGAKAAEMIVGHVAVGIGDTDFRPFAADSWVALLAKADDEIERDHSAGETTCVVVAMTEEGRIVGTSVGDSGALVIGADGRDDDLTVWQKRNRRLGSGSAIPIVFERPASAGVLVVATDGLISYAPAPRITEVVLAAESLDEAAEGLVRLVRRPNGDLMDDVAIVLVRGP